LSLRPHQYSRRVLLAVSGLSPQVVTETVYGLAVSAPEAERFIPTEIEVVTTTTGAERLRRSLFESGQGILAALCRDYGLGSVKFDESGLHCVLGPDGQPLPDIRTADDNARMADAIANRVRQLTSDPACALHVSLAGGRKTMGYYAGYALSLFGREQDRLSHVLVSEPFETATDFWYPPPQARTIRLRGLPEGQDEVSTARAEVSLAQIPFVRLRQGLPKALLEGRSGFGDVVAAAEMALVAPRLRLHLDARVIEVDGQRLELQPAPFAFYAALAGRALHGKPALPAPPKDVHDPDWAAEVIADMRGVYGLMNMPQGMEDSLLKDCSGSKISPMLSRLRRGLALSLAPSRLGMYFDDGGTHRHKRYAIPLPASHISVVRPDGARQQRGKLAEDAPSTQAAHTGAAWRQTIRGDDE
jgi:CRISPR-associated protein (TIGR02584 family)